MVELNGERIQLLPLRLWAVIETERIVNLAGQGKKSRLHQNDLPVSGPSQIVPETLRRHRRPLHRKRHSQEQGEKKSGTQEK